MTREELILTLADLSKGTELAVKVNSWGELALVATYSVSGGTISKTVLKGES